MIFFINFKIYETGTGERAVNLAKIAERISRTTSADIRLCVQATDIYRIKASYSLPLFSQHLDPIDYGPYTGKILPEALRAAGAGGVLINHAEDRVAADLLEKTVTAAKKIGLDTLVCCQSLEEAKAISRLSPTFLAYEPPELIAGKLSVSEAKPEIIGEFVKSFPKDRIIVGAGINSPDDIVEAKKLGAAGVLVSSAIMTAENPERIIKEMARACV